MSFSCQPVHVSPRPAGPHPGSLCRFTPPSRAVRGSFRKTMGEVTERHAESSRQKRGTGPQRQERRRWRGPRSSVLQRRNFCKSCARALSAARRPVVFSLSQPCFNCRFIFRQTGCLHLGLSASRALREKRGSAAPP